MQIFPFFLNFVKNVLDYYKENFQFLTLKIIPTQSLITDLITINDQLVQMPPKSLFYRYSMI